MNEGEKLRANAEYGKRAQSVAITAEDIDVIRKALALYVEHRRREYHHAASMADEETALRLSIAYQSDKEYVFRLLRKVGDGKLDARTEQDQEPSDD